MAAEFIVAGRLPLPSHPKPWTYALQNDEGGLEVYECAVAYEDPATVFTEVGKIVGWHPQSVVMVRKAWDQSEPVSSMAELELRPHHAFMHPEPFFARWERDEQSLEPDPEAEDWSDL